MNIILFVFLSVLAFATVLLMNRREKLADLKGVSDEVDNQLEYGKNTAMFAMFIGGIQAFIVFAGINLGLFVMVEVLVTFIVGVFVFGLWHYQGEILAEHNEDAKARQQYDRQP